MVDRKKTRCTEEKVNGNVRRTRKGVDSRKSKKQPIRVKRRKLGIYEIEQSILNKIQCINNNQRNLSEKIWGIYDDLYIK
jgi:hypothetical protein